MTINREHLAGLELARTAFREWLSTCSGVYGKQLDDLIAQAQAAPEAEPVEVAADAFSMSAAGLVTWTADELADGKRGIRWVMDDKVYGRPTDHDVREYLAGNPNACGCPCDNCNPATPQHDAELVELLREAVLVLDGWNSTDDLDALQERIDAKLATLSAKNEGGKA